MPISTVFDANCYLNRYPDVKNLWRGSAIDHWNQHGQSEGRKGGCDLPGTVYTTEFNEQAYLSRYPDVKNLWRGSGYDHWTQHGQSEGRIGGAEILTEGVQYDIKTLIPGTYIFVKPPASTTPIPGGSTTDNAQQNTDDPVPSTNTPVVNKDGTISTPTDASKKKTYLVVGGIALALIVVTTIVVIKRRK